MLENILLVWHCAGGSFIEAYSIPGDHPDAEQIKTCHGVYINEGRIAPEHFIHKLQKIINSEELSKFGIYNNLATYEDKNPFNLMYPMSKVFLIVCGWYRNN